jgi:hypothetical protein
VSHEVDRAEDSLREIQTLTGRTRLASRSMVTGFPLIGWGVAYVVGLGALDLLDGVQRIAVAAVAYLIGIALSWLPTHDVIRTGAEGRLHVAWVVVLIGTPFLIIAARPQSFVYAMLLGVALWGLAMCLYGVATYDPLFAAVAGSGTILAGVLAMPDLTHPLACFGLGAGLPLLALGAVRAARGVRHV